MARVRIAFQKKNYKNSNILGKIFSILIRIWTLSKYFHTNILIDDTVYDMQFNGLFRYHISVMNKELFDIIEIPNELTNDINFKKAMNKLDVLHANGVKYDWSGILFSQFLWFIRKHSERRYFCSELTMYFLFGLIIDDDITIRFKNKSHHYCPKRVFNTLKNILKRGDI